MNAPDQRTTATASGSRKCRRFALALLAGAAMVNAAGCATAKVSNVTTSQAAVPAPSEILVDVGLVQGLESEQYGSALQLEDGLRADMLQRLAKAGLVAAPFSLQAVKINPGAAVLHVAITQADRGSFVKRVVIGFGAGKAKLQVNADLETLAGQAMTAFNTAADSGQKPGLILPGSVALATGKLVHLVIGGSIDVATNVHGGFSRSVKETSSAIVDQVKSYYQAAGWRVAAES